MTKKSAMIILTFSLVFETAAWAQQSVDTVPSKKPAIRIQPVDPPTPDRGPLRATPSAGGVPMGAPTTAPADSAGTFSITREHGSPWGAMILAGLEVRGERDVNGSYVGNNYFNIAVGARYKELNFLGEFANHTQSTGNPTLGVDQLREDILGWVYWTPPRSWNRLSPLVGAGIGAYHVKVTTKLSGVATEDSSDWKLMGGAAVGVKFDMPVIWISMEARLLAGDEFDPQPTAGILGRLGIRF